MHGKCMYSPLYNTSTYGTSSFAGSSCSCTTQSCRYILSQLAGIPVSPAAFHHFLMDVGRRTVWPSKSFKELNWLALCRRHMRQASQVFRLPGGHSKWYFGMHPRTKKTMKRSDFCHRSLVGSWGLPKRGIFPQKCVWLKIVLLWR